MLFSYLQWLLKFWFFTLTLWAFVIWHSPFFPRYFSLFLDPNSSHSTHRQHCLLGAEYRGDGLSAPIHNHLPQVVQLTIFNLSSSGHSKPLSRKWCWSGSVPLVSLSPHSAVSVPRHSASNTSLFICLPQWAVVSLWISYFWVPGLCRVGSELRCVCMCACVNELLVEEKNTA